MKWSYFSWNWKDDEKFIFKVWKLFGSSQEWSVLIKIQQLRQKEWLLPVIFFVWSSVWSGVWVMRERRSWTAHCQDNQPSVIPLIKRTQSKWWSGATRKYWQVRPCLRGTGGETGAAGVVDDSRVSAHGGEDGAAGVSPQQGAGAGAGARQT